MEFIKNDHEGIIAWEVDADKSVRPNYPMWKDLVPHGSLVTLSNQ